MKARILAASLLAGTTASASANLVVTNVADGAGSGLNDTTPVLPVGGNAGTTHRAQRLAVFEEAAPALGPGRSTAT